MGDVRRRLTDVDADSGPHAFVKGPQRSPKLLARRPRTQEDVEAAFGRDALQVFLAPRGTAFLKSARGLHRATPTVTGHRLIYSVT